MEPRQRAEFSLTTYQLTEQYRVGSPLALYHMQARWIRFCQVIRRVLLGAVICVVLFILVIGALFFYQYLIVFDGQMPDLQERLLGLPGIIIGLLGCVECMIFRYIIAQKVPATLLVCTEGVLEIHPKQVDVTRWDEIRGLLQGPGVGEKKRYRLNRINRKPLFFGEAFEDVESLADLIRQQIQVRVKNLS